MTTRRSRPLPAASGPGPRSPVAEAVAGLTSRRRFLGAGMAAGATLGLPLMGCVDGGDDELPAAAPGPASPLATGPTETRTHFFNLSNHPTPAATHRYFAAGRSYVLERVADRPEVLARERVSNEFLRSVADAQITHHVENVEYPSDAVSICYQHTDIDAATWMMNAVSFYIPGSGATYAFAQAQAMVGSGAPLPTSVKRQRYDVRAAASARDFWEERALIDTSDQAAALLGMHPDLMSLEPNSAHHLHSNYVDNDIATFNLSLALDPKGKYGPAMPAPPGAPPGQKNATGWGTLSPVLGADNKPYVNEFDPAKQRRVYQPGLHPDIRQTLIAGTGDLIDAVKSDETLGRNITGLKPATAPAMTGDPAFAGTLWMRHDGRSHVADTGSPAAVAAGASASLLTLLEATPGSWFWPTATISDRTVSLSLLNWALRFLGVYVEFLDTSTSPPTVLKLADLDEYAKGTIISGHEKGLDSDTTMYVGLLGSAFAVLGIPVAPGFTLPSFTMPAKAVQARLLAGGLSFQGGNSRPDTVVPGAIMTGIFNYGVTSLLAAIGAGAGVGAVFELIPPIASALVSELIIVISTYLNAKNGAAGLVDLLSSASFWENQALAIAKLIVTRAAGVAMAKVIALIVGESTTAAVIDAIPIAGWISLGISVGVGVISVIETSAELALSPWTFVDTLVPTHNLRVPLLPAADGPGTFPPSASQCTVTALFDDGTPHKTTIALDPANPPRTLPPVVFQGVPLGGFVSVEVSFYGQTKSGAVGPLLGKAESGRVSNTVDTLPTLQITEYPYPIDATTLYVHQRKTTFDASAGARAWVETADAPTLNRHNAPTSGRGSVTRFNGITVRDGSFQPPAPSYIGYSWYGDPFGPDGVPACASNSGGASDFVVNLNADVASAGYAVAGCGLLPGVRIAYSLFGTGGLSYYLDTSGAEPIVRRVVLDGTPSFDAASAGLAHAVLNRVPDSLLLHPANYVVGVNTANHRLEIGKLSSTGLPDAVASVSARAQVRAGQGSRPGLLNAPLHSAVSSDGTIVVLEQGDPSSNVPARLQAFDIGGNPVPFFSKQPLGNYFLVLSATPNTRFGYLDMALEPTGFCYVLSYDLSLFAYRLDIYNADQTGTAPIATTSGFNAARIAVDKWRSLYALNYEVLVRPTGLAEPTVSVWGPQKQV